MSSTFACGKIKFSSRSDAERAMRDVLARTGKRKLARPHAYRCERCGFYHWGTKARDLHGARRMQMAKGR